MGSIYKKGRDGYYYYQTYLFNEKTGKKDKKVFHSLGTKSYEEAIIKQKRLDEKYLNKGKKHLLKVFPTKELFKYLSIIIITIFGTIYVSKIFEMKNEKDFSLNNMVISEEASDSETVFDSLLIKDALNNKKLLSEDTIEDIKDTIVSSYDKLDFNIERVEKHSSSLDLAKIYAISDSNYQSSQLKQVCRKIATQHTQFSNIIICLYSKSPTGVRLALGDKKFIRKDLYGKSWLAFYTYNEVEGEYFDDNPSGYLGRF